MHWPLLLHLDSHTRDLGDPLLQAWQVAWGGHALTHQPLSYFQSNTFWPTANSLAFSDALIGYAPTGAIGGGAQSALVRYNLLFLFAPALAFVAACLLARELGARDLGALVAGAVFAYPPWRLAQLGHLHVISTGGIPLSLFFLVRGYRRQHPWMILAGWLTAIWQLSLGFTLGLQFAYLLMILGLVVLGTLVVTFLSWGDGLHPTRPVMLASAVGMLGFFLWGAIQAQPYLGVLRDHPQARRVVPEVTAFSPPMQGLLAAPEHSLVWGHVTSGLRSSLNNEQTIFPGLVALGLAGIGVRAPIFSRGLRLGLVAAVVGCTILSLGFGVPIGRFTYGLLYEHAPGWQGIRTPGRIMTLTTLALALLAAAGAQALIGWLGARVQRKWVALGAEERAQPLVQKAVGAALLVVILAEGSGGLLPLVAVPPVPSEQLGLEGPQLHLPSSIPQDPLYMYWSTEGFPLLVNGFSGFVPRTLVQVRAVTSTFPSAQSVAALQSLGVRTVVLHTDLARDTPWQDAVSRPVDGLPLTKQVDGELVIYHLHPTGPR